MAKLNKALHFQVSLPVRKCAKCAGPIEQGSKSDCCRKCEIKFYPEFGRK